MRLALYQPQIPQNTGTLLRLGSCLGIAIDIIRPIGFIFDDKKLKRSGMDYLKTANYKIHDSFELFYEMYSGSRFIAMSSNNITIAHNEFSYTNNDILIVGSEHYGFLESDLLKIKHIVKIPMLPEKRSLNMAISAAIVISEAMSQLKIFPKLMN